MAASVAGAASLWAASVVVTTSAAGLAAGAGGLAGGAAGAAGAGVAAAGGAGAALADGAVAGAAAGGCRGRGVWLGRGRGGELRRNPCDLRHGRAVGGEPARDDEGGDGTGRGGRDQRPQRAPGAGADVLGVVGGGGDMGGGDHVPVLAVGGEQGFVGQHVDAPGQPFGDARDVARGGGTEHRGAAVTGGVHAEVEIGGDLVRAQRAEPEMVGDAVLELAHVAPVEQGVEFGLAEQHQLQQLVAAGLEVGEQADLFERGRRHGVGFVDEHHDAAAVAVAADEVVLHRAEQRAGTVAAQRQAELGGNGLQQRVRGKAGVGQVDGIDGVGQAFEQHPAEHGLAGTDFAADLDDAFVVHDGVEQRVDGGAALGAGEEEVGERGEAEGGFAQAVVVEIHGGGPY